MWMTVGAILFSLLDSPLPKLAETTFQKQVLAHFQDEKIPVAKKVKKVKKVIKGFSTAEYTKRFKGELKKKGKPDEVAFLLSLIQGESNGKPLAVSFIPSKPLPDGKKSKNLWHCGLTQIQCKTLGECHKVQRDPVYAATRNLEILRYMDKWKSSRACNWAHGPGHKKCREIRARIAPSS
ncbi:MAG: hypothetical protein WC824_14630 [Bacteroidota bacterium]|jgi:hypothetical protein